jgi:hypothetical protein
LERGTEPERPRLGHESLRPYEAIVDDPRFRTNGQHGLEVLRDAGYGAAEIESLATSGAVEL